jgi:predicted GNAT family acetyltransferase
MPGALEGSAPADDEGLRVADNPSKDRYELHRGDDLIGVIDYRREDDTVTLDHVFVQPAYRNRGLASRLVADAVEDIESRGLTAVPVCPFAVWYLEHP